MHCFNHERTLVTILKVLDTTDGKHSTICTLDAVGSWQIILPMPNLERPYLSDKGSEAVLKCLQYKRCAGPQKVSKFRF